MSEVHDTMKKQADKLGDELRRVVALAMLGPVEKILIEGIIRRWLSLLDDIIRELERNAKS